MDISALKHFLSAAGRVLLTENLLIVGIVMWTARGHFRKLEEGLAQVAFRVQEQTKALMGLEQKHSQRMADLEFRHSGRMDGQDDRISGHEKRIERLEDHTKQRRARGLEGGK